MAGGGDISVSVTPVATAAESALFRVSLLLALLLLLSFVLLLISLTRIIIAIIMKRSTACKALSDALTHLLLLSYLQLLLFCNIVGMESLRS